MVYYFKKDYKLLGFKKSNYKNKMYNAVLQNNKNNKIINIQFGDKLYENYQDKTGLNLFPYLIHNDSKRRNNYRARSVGKVRNEFYSPSYFSYNYLW